MRIGISPSETFETSKEYLALYDCLVPMYPMRCSCGLEFEVFRAMSEAPKEAPCPECTAAATRIFTPLNARIEDSENIGAERNDETSGTYITLPDIPVGRDAAGRMQFRPHTVADIPNRAAFKEVVKRYDGLSLGDGGRYRSTR